jgi:hypothetical protein
MRFPSIFALTGKKLLLLALGAAALLLGGGFWIWNQGTKDALAEAKQRVRDAGLPMRIEEMLPPPVADEDNAALIFAQVELMLAALPEVDGHSISGWLSEFESEHRTDPLDEAAATELAARMESPEMMRIMALIREAAAKKGYSAPPDYDRWSNTWVTSGPFPETHSLILPARLLLASARLAASRKHAEEACAEVWRITTLAEFKAGELVWGAEERLRIWSDLVKRELERLAAAGLLTQAWNEKFSQRLALADIRSTVPDSIDGERILMGETVIERMLAGKTNVYDIVGGRIGNAGWKENLGYYSYHLPAVIRLQYARYIEIKLEERRVVRAMESVPTRFWSYYSELDKHGAKETDPPLLRSVLRGSRSRHVLGDQFDRWHLDILQVGLALERYHATKGGYPVTLAALVPDFLKELPRERFTGRPMGYSTEPGGAVIHGGSREIREEVMAHAPWPMNTDFPSENELDVAYGWFSGAAAARKFALPPTPPAGTSSPDE